MRGKKLTDMQKEKTPGMPGMCCSELPMFHANSTINSYSNDHQANGEKYAWWKALHHWMRDDEMTKPHPKG